MTLKDLRDRVRRDLDDMAQPYLYTDEEIAGWLNEAVTEAVIRARLLRDDAVSRPSLCVVALEEGQVHVPLSPLVLVVRHATIAGAPRPLTRITSKSLDRIEPGWSERDMTNANGGPEYLVLDLTQGAARLFPPAVAGTALHLRVWRKPLEAERMEVPDDEPCVNLPEPTDLKDWALRCAYLVKDSELYDPDRAAQHEAAFERRFGPRPDAQTLARFLDNPPTRPRGHFF